MGGDLLLIDEDTCATNFMIRDNKMMFLVAPEKEPITPFLQKARSMYEAHGVSCIPVIDGSGDYFDVADTVVMMDCYNCLDLTSKAKELAGQSPSLAFGGIN
jgi:predicted ABC-class ATPase